MSVSNTLHVEVTQDDIKNGIRRNSDCCPIALALRRASGGTNSERIDVNPRTISFWDGESRRICGTPPDARKFIADFDDRLMVAPLAFDLELEGR
jgi:hypothetical protein